MNEQQQNLERVSSSIAPIVLEFCRATASGGMFRMHELVAYVQARATVAPDSPSRILRDLAKRGQLAYRVVNRSQSLYQLESVAA